MNVLQYQVNTRRAQFMNSCNNAGTVTRSHVPPFQKSCDLCGGTDTVEAYKIHHLQSSSPKCPSLINRENHNHQSLSVLVVSIAGRYFCSFYILDKDACSRNVLSFDTQLGRGSDSPHDKTFVQSI